MSFVSWDVGVGSGEAEQNNVFSEWEQQQQQQYLVRKKVVKKVGRLDNFR